MDLGLSSEPQASSSQTKHLKPPKQPPLPNNRKRPSPNIKSSPKKKQKTPLEQDEGLSFGADFANAINLELLPAAQPLSRRDTAALAWEALIPSLVYPLAIQLAQNCQGPLHYDNPPSTEDSPTYCSSGCSISKSKVKVIGFKGGYGFFFILK